MRHETIEKSLNLMVVLIVAAISIGGLVEIVPLMMSSDSTEPDEGISVYSPLRLAGRRKRSVTFCLAAERAHHLRMTAVAAFANVDIAPCETQRRVGLDVFRRFRRLARHHERQDFDQTTDTDREHDQDHHQVYAFFNRLMTHEWSLLYAGSSTATGAGFCALTVLKTL